MSNTAKVLCSRREDIACIEKLKKMEKVLYVYGYGGSPSGSTATTLRRLLPQCEVLCVEYPQHDARLANAQLCHLVKSEQISVVVASSLGAFLALTIPDVRRIIINPCMLPTVELPKISVPKHIYATYGSFEQQVMYPDAATAQQTIGIFSTRDELLGNRYYEHFKQHYAQAFTTDRCGHKANEDMLFHDVVPLIENFI